MPKTKEAKPMRRFKLLSSSHRGKGEYDKETGEYTPGEEFKAGAIIETTDPLTDMFANKFEELPAEESREFKAAQKARAKSEEEAEDETTMTRDQKIKRNIDPDDTDKIKDNKPTVGLESATSDLGENVTAEFDKAMEANLLVLKDDKDYYLARPDEPDEALGDSLKKSQVNGAIAKQMKEDSTPPKTSSKAAKASGKASAKSSAAKKSSSKARDDEDDEEDEDDEDE